MRRPPAGGASPLNLVSHGISEKNDVVGYTELGNDSVRLVNGKCIWCVVHSIPLLDAQRETIHC